ncbi:MAG: hypothetical protein V2I36_08410, partial [Desulfopila sp.]|nr:hypothetical protein [Desulfopila sp.]
MQPEKRTFAQHVGNPTGGKRELLLFRTPQVVARDGRYVAYDNGIVCDCFANTEWFRGPDEDISWSDASNWAARLTIGGGGWSLATIDQLEGLYCKNRKKDRITPLLHLDATDVWSSETEGESSAWG